jgi:Leucine-rich repeat (LRR) protein
MRSPDVNDPSSAEVVFFAALEKGGPAERAAYLDEACAGNEALRRRVEALLAAHEQVGGFLERPLVEAEGVAALAGGESAAEDLSFLGPPTEPGSLGRLDHYEVLEVVGRGGTGVVLRARDTKLERVVALKVLAAPLAASGTARQRFAREARAAAAVRDDHVIAILAVRDDAPIPYLVMEFIDGCNLAALLHNGGPLEVQEVLRIDTQVASGLAAAHRLGLVHRDVKPANILLENGVQRVKLTDFGLARTADDASLTQTGLIAGTPLYMAPEQANGQPLDCRADLFSLGSVLYELCTGQLAFRAPTTVAVLRRVSDETPQPIREVNPDMPPPLCRLIEQLHAKKPANRPASAQEVADRLAGLLAELSETHPRRGGLLGILRSAFSAARRAWFGRRPYLWAAAALVLLLAGLGMGEATGVTEVRGSAIRLFFPEGALVVQVDDPRVSVAVDGADVVITGAGVREIRLKSGQYTVEASKDGKVVRRELVTVTRDGRQVVRVSKETAPLTEAERWEKCVAEQPAEQQVEAVVQRLKELHPRFDGAVAPTFSNGVVIGLALNTNQVSDLSPLRALARLEALECKGYVNFNGLLSDLSPLRGLPLKRLIFHDNPVTDLSPLRDMPLRQLGFARNYGVKDLTPLKGLPLEFLDCSHTNVSDLSPLQGMKLTWLWCDQTLVADLKPLRGMPLKELRVPYTRVSDLKPLRGMPLESLAVIETPVSDMSPLRGMALKELDVTASKVTDLSPIRDMPLTLLRLTFRRAHDAEIVRSLKRLQSINGKAVAEFWKEVDGK